MNILVVGAGGNIGRYLSSHLEVDKFSRNSRLEDFLSKSYDIIIYCASNTGNLKINQLSNYFYDNYGLLSDVLKIKHQYLIYFSSVDVYSKNIEICSENVDIDIREIISPYAFLKLLSEELIQKIDGNRFVILRPSMMISSCSPLNNLKRLIEDDYPTLSVSKESEYNLVSYENVLNAVKYFIKTRQSGIFNLASDKNIKLLDLAEKLNKRVVWGHFSYRLNKIDITKISKIVPQFRQTSEQIILGLYKDK